MTFVANLKKKRTPPPLPPILKGRKPFWELHIFRFQSVAFCVEFSGNQIFRKSPQNFFSSGVALRRKVCTPPPPPTVYKLKVSRAKTDQIPGFSQWETKSNKFSPYFQQLTATHLGQVTFLLQSAKT